MRCCRIELQRVPPINIHNVKLAKRCATRIIGMTGGNVVFDGPPEALEKHHLSAIYGGEDWHA